MNPRGSSGSRRCATIVLRRASLWSADDHVCRFSVVVFQQSTKPLSALDGVLTLRHLLWRRHEDHIALALVRAFLVIMGRVRGERMPQRAFTKQEQPRQHFFLHRANPPLREGIQIRRPRRQWYTRPGVRNPHSAMVTFRAICIIQR
jgi:hypothetical protein